MFSFLFIIAHPFFLSKFDTPLPCCKTKGGVGTNKERLFATPPRCEAAGGRRDE
jgi:hypothetical protein